MSLPIGEGVCFLNDIINKDMINHDLCIAWNWEYDTDFITLLDTTCRQHGLSLLQITPENLLDELSSLVTHQVAFKAFWDRASETDERFIPLVQLARNLVAYCINPYEKASKTWDKGAMHQIINTAGLHTPYTIILPPYKEQPLLPPMDLSLLGGRFTIKPAHGGGGEGVVIEATSLRQALEVRQEYPEDRYLLQAHVVPVYLETRAAWFRMIYCAGWVYPCWWDTRTHVYTSVTSSEEIQHHLYPLRDITVSLARLCGLDLFSTEIALTEDRHFVIIDYVNDQIDLRLQSKAMDGVPDHIVHDIAERLVRLIANCTMQPGKT